MRISFAKLLIVIAFCVVMLVELRTVFAFFGVDIPPLAIVGFGVVLIGTLILWAIFPADDNPT